MTIDEVSTPIGNWTIFFLDSERFNVYFRREGMTFYENLGRYGEVGKLYSNTDFGIQIDISDTDSRFGDVHRFDTYRELDGTIRLRNFRNYNDGDGTVRITGIEDESIQTNQTSGEWVIFFLDSKRFEIHGQNGRPLLDDEGLNITGTVGNEISIPSIDAKIEIHDGKYTFHFGDRFTFKTLFTGTVRAQLSQLGTIALMYNSDYASPGIQLWVNGLSPKDSAVIPPRPSISLMLSDANGIDMKSLSFLVSINDRGFHDVPKDDYVVSDRYQLDNVPIFYSPIMDIGKYRYRISVKDFNGNAAKGDQGDFSEFMFLVEEKADLSPPSIDLTVDGQILINQQVLRKSPEFNISISDDHAIDKASISILFGKEGAIEPLKENEYIISLSGDLRSAKIAYTPELINGVYEIQAKANDMSNNTGYLSSPDIGPIKFILDEKVEVKDIINAPNPFSNTTVFSYFLTQPADKVTVKIYTMRGRLIKTIEQDSPSWKYNEEFWDGRDEDGNRLASGVYFYKFIANDKEKRIEKIGKLAIIR